MVARAYIDFCETLWSDWCASQLGLPSDISCRFQLDHMPEPYLRFGNGVKPFYVLFTNPGAGMPHQHRKAVKAGCSCVAPQMLYHEASLSLAEFYLRLPPGHARRNIDAMKHIGELVNADCVMQFESLPFHSSSLPGKAEIPRVVAETKILKTYASVLAEAMQGVSVVALSAVSSLRSISRSSVADSTWLSWQASLLGIDPGELTLTRLTRKRGKTTSAFLHQRVGRCVRGFVLTMGGNTFPGIGGQELLARTLNSLAGACRWQSGR